MIQSFKKKMRYSIADHSLRIMQDLNTRLKV